MSPFDYFADDEDGEQRKKSSNNEFFYYESEVNFSLSQYVTFILFHLCYFTVLGPLIVLLLLCLPGWRTLFVNMAFLKLDIVGLRQAFFWLAGMLVFVFFGLKLSTGRWESIDLALVCSILNGSLYRSASVATKYATYPKKQIEKIYKVVLSAEEQRSEVTVIGWANQGAAIRYSELTQAIERYEIDRSTLRISFMSKVSDLCTAELQVLNKARQGGETLVICRKTLNKEILYYNSEYLVEYLIVCYNRTVRPKCHNWTARFLGLLLSVSVVIFRPMTGTYFYGDTWVEICIQLIALWNYYYMNFFQIKFFVQSVVDLRRKVFLMQQLSMVMTVKSAGKSVRKLLPTLNLIDEVSLHSWLNMRRIGLDYGKKFVYRREILLPVFLSMMAVNFIGVWAIYYLTSSGRDAFGKIAMREWRTLYYYMMFQGAFMMFQSFVFMYEAGSLNDEFKNHINSIEKNRLYFKDILKFRAYYFKDLRLPDSLDLTELFSPTPASYLRMKLCREILGMVLNHSSDAQQSAEVLDGKIEERLANIIECYDQLLEGLNHDLEFNHVKILGMTITRSGSLNLLVALLSILFASYQLATGSG